MEGTPLRAYVRVRGTNTGGLLMGNAKYATYILDEFRLSMRAKQDEKVPI